MHALCVYMFVYKHVFEYACVDSCICAYTHGRDSVVYLYDADTK